MLFALICKDKPGSLELRTQTRPPHVEYLTGLNDSGSLKMAGPLLDDDGKPCGSLLVVEANDKVAARALSEGDPYAKAGLFETVEVHGFNWVFNAPAS